MTTNSLAHLTPSLTGDSCQRVCGPLSLLKLFMDNSCLPPPLHLSIFLRLIPTLGNINPSPLHNILMSLLRSSMDDSCLQSSLSLATLLCLILTMDNASSSPSAHTLVLDCSQSALCSPLCLTELKSKCLNSPCQTACPSLS